MSSSRLSVRDEVAYEEKLGMIMEGWSGPFMDPYQDALKAATETVFSKVCTEASYGDWTAAWYLCAQTCRQFDDQTAAELMADIRHAVEKAQFWREALKMR